MNRGLFFVLTLTLLVGTLNVASNVHEAKAWTGTIYIRANGSIDPPSAPISTLDNVTYTLTGNITSDADGIVVERDNIVVNGSDLVVEGIGAGYHSGIQSHGRSNATIQNISVRNFFIGIWLNSSSNNSISGNTIIASGYYGIWLDSSSNHNSINGTTIADNYFGIRLDSSSNNSVSGNTITNNGSSSNNNGIFLVYSTNNSINGNILTNNRYGIELASSSNNSVSWNNVANSSVVGITLDSSFNNSVSGNTFTDGGLYVWHSYANSVENNVVNGRPLVYLEGIADYRVEDAGQVVLVRCNGIRVEDLSLSRTYVGVEFLETNNSVVSGNIITATSWMGIGLYSSSNNSVSGNTIADNHYGIWLDSSSNSSIAGNKITNNSDWGITFYSSSNCSSINGNSITDNGMIGIYIQGNSSNTSIFGNNITRNNGFGIALEYSDDSSISWNNITNNSNQGISLYSCSNNSIIENDIANNGCGMELFSSSGNSVYHNDFVNNAQQVNSVDSRNAWDDGYPSGGNHWSNYSGTDANHDGIGDTPHVIDANNTDHYPVMSPFIIPEFPSFIILSLVLAATLLGATIHRRRRR